MWGFSDCRAVSDLLWNYTAHRLGEDDVERVERHLAACDLCRAEVQSYRQTVEALTAMRSGPVLESRRGWHELQTRLSAPSRRPLLALPRWGLPVATWGSALAAAALAILIIGHPGGLQGSQSAPESGAATYGN